MPTSIETTVSLVISIIAILVSLVTPYLLFFKPVKVRFVRPQRLILQPSVSNDVEIVVPCVLFNAGSQPNAEIFRDISAILKNRDTNQILVNLKWEGTLDLEINYASVDVTKLKPASALHIPGNGVLYETLLFGAKDARNELATHSCRHFRLEIKMDSALESHRVLTKLLDFDLTDIQFKRAAMDSFPVNDVLVS